jgi:hypothetical protein
MEIGEQLKVPAAIAADVLSKDVTLKVTIKKGSKVLYTGSIDEDFYYTPDQYGSYRIEYSATAVDAASMGADGTTVMMCNDGADMFTGEGLVFMLAVMTEEAAAGACYTVLVNVMDDSTSVTISIRTEGEIVTQIDPKYIPGGAGGGGGVAIVELMMDFENMAVTTANKTFAELDSYYANGTFIYAAIGGGGMVLGHLPLNGVVSGEEMSFQGIVSNRMCVVAVTSDDEWLFEVLT